MKSRKRLKRLKLLAISQLRRLRHLDMRKALPLALLVMVLAGVLCSCVPSCGDRDNITLFNSQKFHQNVPIIRVKLGSHSETFLATNAGYRLSVDGRDVYGANNALSPTQIRRSGRNWLINDQAISGDVLELRPFENTLFVYCQTYYRGSLVLRALGDDQFIAINHVDMESYLAGVLPKELRSMWLEETYKALAVTARTFARYQAVTVGPSNVYDVTDDQASQVYGGYSAETPKSRSAVMATRGQMLVYNGQGQQGIFLAQYSASCGGIVNAAQVLRNAAPLQPLLGGQTCNDCSACPRYRWSPVKVNKSDVYRALAAAYPAAAGMGSVTDVRVAERTNYGRQLWLDIVGSSGAAPLRIRADDLRLALLRAKVSGASSIYSMNCQIRSVGESLEFYDGRGFGHGVGLCQWGAEGKAEKGWKAQQILAFYYPGAGLMKVY